MYQIYWRGSITSDYAFFFVCYADHPALHVLTPSSPTRRSSSLDGHGRAIDQPWIDLAAMAPDVPPSRNAVAAALLAALLPALERFDRDGLPAFLPRHAGLDALAGRDIVLHGGDGDRSGTALGLAPDGALRVRLADGRVQAFHAGEVSVRPR